MMSWRILIAELSFRRGTAMVTLLITAATTMTVFFLIGLSDLMAGRTRLIQRDIGLNLRFIPAGTDLDRYWMKGYSEGTIDEGLVDTLEAQDVANRLVPMLQRTIPWGEGEAILTGIGRERFARNKTMKPVFGGLVDEEEAIILGSVAAEMIDAKEGDTLTVLGLSGKVKRVLASEGSSEDLRVHMDLSTVQSLLGLTGKINEIRALECNCEEGITDPEEHLRSILEPLLPGTIMIRQDKLADARRKQRQLLDRLSMVAMPVVVVLAVFIVAALIILNTYQRRREMGLYSVLGRGPEYVGGLIWGRALLLGCVGGLAGATLAWCGLAIFGESLLGAAAKPNFHLQDWLASGLLGGAITSVAAILPVILMMNLEPAIVLRGE